MRTFEDFMKAEEKDIKEYIWMNDRWYNGISAIEQKNWKKEYNMWDNVNNIRLANLREYTEYHIAYLINQAMNNFLCLSTSARYEMVTMSFSRYYNSGYHNTSVDKNLYNTITESLGLTLDEADSIFSLMDNEIRNDRAISDGIHNKLVQFVNNKLGTRIPTKEEIDKVTNEHSSNSNTLTRIKLIETQYRAGFRYLRPVATFMNDGSFDNGILRCDRYYGELQGKLRQEEVSTGDKKRH